MVGRRVAGTAEGSLQARVGGVAKLSPLCLSEPLAAASHSIGGRVWSLFLGAAAIPPPKLM